MYIGRGKFLIGVSVLMGIVFGLLLTTTFSSDFAIAADGSTAGTSPTRVNDTVQAGEPGYIPIRGWNFSYTSKPPSQDIFFEWHDMHTDGFELSDKVFNEYKIDYVRSAAPDKTIVITQETCYKGAEWRTLEGPFTSPRGSDSFGGTVKYTITGGMTRVIVPTYFRLVGIADGKSYPLVCGTKPINPMHIRPDGRVFIEFRAIDSKTKKSLRAKVTYKPDSTEKELTITPKKVPFDPNETINQASHTVTFSLAGYKSVTQLVRFDVGGEYEAKMGKTESTVTATTDETVGPSGVVSIPAPASAGTTATEESSEENCNSYLGLLSLKFTEFNPVKWIICHVAHFIKGVLGFVGSLVIDSVETNPWSYISDNNRQIILLWKVSLSLIDLIVVGGLLVSAFANIFRLKIDTYGIKQILPGLIIGVILANLSFFIMRLFIEMASIITQEIAIVVAHYISEPIGNSKAGSYLLVQSFVELVNSLLNHNPFIPGIPAVSSGNFQILDLVNLIFKGLEIFRDLFKAPFLFVVFLVFMLILLILFMVLMFLLYIRNFIIVILFILSPIAFLALGFPPLRSVWQKWWQNFWKWLIMLPLSLAIIGFMVLFLHFSNRSVNMQPDISGFTDFFFRNGVAVFLLWYAMRIPFIFGSFFGINIMDKWGGFGAWTAKQAHAGAKKGWDRIGEARNTRRFGTAPVTGLAAVAGTTRGAVVSGVTREDGETDASFLYRVNKAESEAHAKNIDKANRQWRAKNIFRAPEALSAGWKARQASAKAAEDYEIRKSNAYQLASGEKGRSKDLFDRMHEEAGAIDDIQGLEGSITDLHGSIAANIRRKYPGMAEGDVRRMAAREIRELQNMQFGPREGAIKARQVAGGTLEGIDKEKLQEGVEYAKRYIALVNRDPATKDAIHTATGAPIRTGADALIAGLTGVGTTAPAPGVAASWEHKLHGKGAPPTPPPSSSSTSPIGNNQANTQGERPTTNPVREGVSTDVPPPVHQALLDEIPVGSRSVIDAVHKLFNGQELNDEERENLINQRQSALSAARALVAQNEDILKQAINENEPDRSLGQQLFRTLSRNIAHGLPTELRDEDYDIFQRQFGADRTHIDQLMKNISSTRENYEMANVTLRQELRQDAPGQPSLLTKVAFATQIASQNNLTPEQIYTQSNQLLTELQSAEVATPAMMDRIVSHAQTLGVGLTDPSISQEKLEQHLQTVRDASELASDQRVVSAQGQGQSGEVLEQVIAQTARERELQMHSAAAISRSTKIALEQNQSPDYSMASDPALVNQVTAHLKNLASQSDEHRDKYNALIDSQQSELVTQTLNAQSQALLQQVHARRVAQVSQPGGTTQGMSHSELREALTQSLSSGFANLPDAIGQVVDLPNQESPPNTPSPEDFGPDASAEV